MIHSRHVFDGIRFGSYSDTSIISTFASFSKGSSPGLHGQEQAADYRVKISGCTVHFVDEGMDTGPIIIQAAVPAYHDDTEETLSERILKQEHKIFPYAIKLYSEGRISVEGRKVAIRGYREDSVMINPPLQS